MTLVFYGQDCGASFVLEKDGQLEIFSGNYLRYRESLKAKHQLLDQVLTHPVDQPKVERPRNNKLSNQFKKEMNKMKAENEKPMKERDALVLLFSEKQWVVIALGSK